MGVALGPGTAAAPVATSLKQIRRRANQPAGHRATDPVPRQSAHMHAPDASVEEPSTPRDGGAHASTLRANSRWTEAPRLSQEVLVV